MPCSKASETQPGCWPPDRPARLCPGPQSSPSATPPSWGRPPSEAAHPVCAGLPAALTQQMLQKAGGTAPPERAWFRTDWKRRGEATPPLHLGPLADCSPLRCPLSAAGGVEAPSSCLFRALPAPSPAPSRLPPPCPAAARGSGSSSRACGRCTGTRRAAAGLGAQAAACASVRLHLCMLRPAPGAGLGGRPRPCPRRSRTGCLWGKLAAPRGAIRMRRRLTCLSRAGSTVLPAAGSGAAVRLLGDRRAEAGHAPSCCAQVSRMSLHPPCSAWASTVQPRPGSSLWMPAPTPPRRAPARTLGCGPSQLGPPPCFTPRT